MKASVSRICHHVYDFIVKHKYYLVLGLIATFLTLPFFHWEGIPWTTISNDTLFHIGRFTSVWRGFLDGQLVPQIDPAMDGGIGLAVNLFYGPLLGYLMIPLRVIFFSWDAAYIFLVWATFFLAVAACYKFVQAISKNKIISLISSTLYVFAPYFLSDVYVRGAWGEITTFIFLPLVFLGIFKIFSKEKFGIVTLVVGATGIALTHLLSILIVAPAALFFILFYFKKIDKTVIGELVVSTVIILGLTAFFWLPILECRGTGLYNIFNTGSFTQRINGTGDLVKKDGLTIAHYFLQDPDYGTNGVSTYNLLPIVFVGLLLLFYACREVPKKIKKPLLMLASLGILAGFLTLKIFPWELMPDFVLNIQFPWRFCIVVNFCFSILGGFGLYYGYRKFNKSAKLHLPDILLTASAICFCVLFTLPYISNAFYKYSHITFEEAYSGANYFTGILALEYLPLSICDDVDHIDTCWKADKIITEHSQPNIVSGEATISNFSKDGTTSQFTISTNVETVIELPHLYYPGFVVNFTNQSGEVIELQKEVSERGFIQILIPASSTGQVLVHYGVSKATGIGVAISSTTIVSIVTVAVASSRRQKRQK